MPIKDLLKLLYNENIPPRLFNRWTKNCSLDVPYYDVFTDVAIVFPANNILPWVLSTSIENM